MALGDIVEQAALLPGKIVTNGLLLVAVAGIGLALVLFRVLFMESCPWLAKHASLAAALADGIMDWIWLMFAEIKLIITAIIDAVRVIEGKHVKKFTIKGPPKKLSVHKVREFLLHFPVRCHDFEWGRAQLIQWPLQKMLNEAICPVLRYLWPLRYDVPWIYNVADAVLGWASFDPNPIGPDGNNCKPDSDDNWVCVAFGVGYIVLEVFLPLLILFVFLWPFVILLLSEAIQVLKKTIKTVYRGWHYISKRIGARVHASL